MLKVKKVSFSYSKTVVLKDISFNLSKGENLAIIGESGSGKSTLLKAIFGTFDLPKGEITWNGGPILGPAYNLVIGYDFMKYVAQEFDLMPFITVEENIGKYLTNSYPEEKSNRIQEILEIIEMPEFAKTKVKNLSGGQKQRVALGRAIANKPEILLLDEPFSHIDNFKKRTLRRNLFKFLKKENISCIVATHDKDDVLAFSDSMIVLRDGKIIAQKVPKEIYSNPKSARVAAFFEEYSILSKSDVFQNGDSKKELIVYASDLKVVEDSSFMVEVLKSYFEGNHYLVEATFKRKPVFFRSDYFIKEGTITCLEYSKNS